MSASGPDDFDLLAAELALGLLDGAEREAAEARLADPAFAARHRLWIARVAAIAMAAPSAKPPLTAWPAIEARRRSGQHMSDPSRRVHLWQAISALAAAAAVVFAILLARTAAQPPATVTRVVPVPPPLVAVLAAPTGDATMAVSIDRRGGELALAPSGLDTGDRAAELWVIPAGGTPLPVGVVASRSRGRAKVVGAALAALVPGATLAISLEPPGGSPTGLPTGPVVLTGKIAVT